MALRRIVISGCSGGGKSTLIGALGQQGYQTMPEAGRLIVQRELSAGGRALPWTDMPKFTENLASLAISQFNEASKFNAPVFFDRCVIEALVAARRFGFALPADLLQGAMRCRYDNPVFIAPPWAEIFENDPERRHSFEDANSEYECLVTEFESAGFAIRYLPKMSNEMRIEFVRSELGI